MMPSNAIKGIDIALDSAERVFDAVVNKNRVEEVLLAMVTNRVINRKTHGEMLVQESSFLYDQELKFYSKLPNGRISHMEVMIPLPKEWNGWVNSLGGLDAFNQLISDLESTDDKAAINAKRKLGDAFLPLLTFSANRIPSQGLNSLEAVKIKKFFPTHAGHKIAVPSELTIKSLSDFDIDKLTSYFKYFYMLKGIPHY